MGFLETLTIEPVADIARIPELGISEASGGELPQQMLLQLHLVQRFELISM
jgi:hypothetical protein